MPFDVVNIIGGDSIEVAGWKWGEYRGKLVKINGINIKNRSSNPIANRRLTALLAGHSVELVNPYKVVRGTEENNDVLYCSVYFNEVNIANYFPEFGL